MYDLFDILNPGTSSGYHATTWKRMVEAWAHGSNFSTHKFPGRGQHDTPVATMKGVLRIVDDFHTPVAQQLKEPQREIFMRALRGEPINADLPLAHQTPESQLSDITTSSQLVASHGLIASAMQQIASGVAMSIEFLRQDKERAERELRDVRAKADEDLREVRAKAEEEARTLKRKADDLTSELHNEKAQRTAYEARVKTCETRISTLERDLQEKKAERDAANDELNMLFNNNMISGRNIAARYVPRASAPGVRLAIEERYRQRNGRAPIKVEFDYNGGTYTDEMYSMKEVGLWIREEVTRLYG